MFCVHCVNPTLSELSGSDPKLNLRNVKKRLLDRWKANDVEFLDRQGESIHGRTLLANARCEPLKVRVVFEVECRREPPYEHGLDELEDQGDSDHAPLEPTNDEPGSFGEFPGSFKKRAVDPQRERLIRELDAQERRRDFVWINYVKDTMVRNFGLNHGDAQALVDELVENEILLLVRRPSLKTPGFQSTGVRLNREHPDVRGVLGNNGHGKRFKPVPIRGEPASATLIRDRR